MNDFMIRLNTINKVKNFVNIVSKFNSNEITMDLVSNRYVVDAKSIMGIFSLDLSKDITLRVYTEDKSLIDKLLEDIDEFLVK